MSFSVGGCVRWLAQTRSAAADSIPNVVMSGKVAMVCGALCITSPVALASREATPPAPAIAPDFEITGNQSLPGLCAPSLVAPRMASVLGAFNAGRALAFARRFTVSAYFEAYNDRPGGIYRASGRAAIASVARKRHRLGDRWTAFKLTAPDKAIGEGIFGLFLRVRAEGFAFEQGAKVIVSCRTGQIRTWLGPSWTLSR
jgi:hypothetical protein